jgi:hypothetical protein
MRPAGQLHSCSPLALHSCPITVHQHEDGFITCTSRVLLSTPRGRHVTSTHTRTGDAVEGSPLHHMQHRPASHVGPETRHTEILHGIPQSLHAATQRVRGGHAEADTDLQGSRLSEVVPLLCA